MGYVCLFSRIFWLFICFTGLPGVWGQVNSLTEAQKIGLYVGCSIGGFIFLMLIVILFCLICRPGREKRYNGSREYYDNPAVLGREKYGSSVTQPVWTSNPNMYAGDAGMVMYGNGVGGGPHGQPPPARQVTNRAPNVFVSDLERRQQWLPRTVRRARQALQRLPAVFHGKKAGEFTYTEFNGTASSSSVLGLESGNINNTTVLFVSWAGQTNMSPTRQDRRQTEVEREVVIGDPVAAGVAKPPEPSEYGAETTAALDRIVGPVRVEKAPTARVYSDYHEVQALKDLKHGGHEAKVYSDFKDPKEFVRNDETGENVARVYSSYSELNGENDNFRNIVRSYNSGLERDRREERGHQFVTQSDWRVYRPPNPVGRSQSNLEHSRRPGHNGPVPRPTSANYQVKKSQEKLYHKLANDPVRYNYMVKKESEMVDQMRQHGSPQLARRPLNPVTRTTSDASNVRHFQAPNDPNAVYAQVIKPTRPQSANVASAVSNHPRPISPRPGSPIQPIIAQQEPILYHHEEHHHPMNGHRMNVQAVIENKSTGGGQDTMAQEGEQITSTAFKFLDSYSCTTGEDSQSVHSRTTDMSLHSGEQFTTQVFGFLNDYPDHEDLPEGGEDSTSLSSSTSTVIERSAHDAFKFLDDWEDTISFGDEPNNLGR